LHLIKNDQLDYLKYGFNIDMLSNLILFFKIWDSKEEYKFSQVRFVKQLENHISSCQIITRISLLQVSVPPREIIMA